MCHYWKSSRGATGASLMALLVLLLSLGACSGRRAKWEKIDLKTMQRLMPEMLVAEAAFAQRSLDDSLRILGYQAILSRHGYTLADWDSSLVWYGRYRIEEYSKIYEYAAATLTPQQKELRRRADSLELLEMRRNAWLSGNVDSVNLLRDSISYHASGSYLERSFTLEPSSGYSAGTELRFLVRLHGAQGRLPSGSLAMQLHLLYSDSTQSIQTLGPLQSGLNRLSITIPEGKTMHSAVGLLRGRLPRTKSKVFVVDSFSVVRYSGTHSPATSPASDEASEEELTSAPEVEDEGGR